MKKIYGVEVDCANCAAKMEKAASALEGVSSLTINFMTQKMTVEYSDSADCDAVLKNIVKTCKKVDSDFELRK